MPSAAVIRKFRITEFSSNSPSVKIFFRDEFVIGSDNVYKDLGFEEDKAELLKWRSYLMTRLIHYIHHKRLSQGEAARRFSVSPRQISSLLHGKIDLFSEKLLLDMVQRVGLRLHKNPYLN